MSMMQGLFTFFIKNYVIELSIANSRINYNSSYPEENNMKIFSKHSANKYTYEETKPWAI